MSESNRTLSIALVLGIFFLLIILTALIDPFFKRGSITGFVTLFPTGGETYINENTIIDISGSPYNTTLVINHSDITLDCNGMVFNGEGVKLYAIYNGGYSNVVVKNCKIENYFFSGIFFNNTNGGQISYNSINSTLAGINVVSSSNTVIDGNNLTSNLVGVSIVRSSSSTISNSNVSGNGGGMYIESSPNTNIQSVIALNIQYDITITNSTGAVMSDITYNSIIREWYLTVNVTNGSYVPIQGASVCVYDKYKEMACFGTGTEENGLTFPLSLKQYVNRSGVAELESFIPYNVTATKTGYLQNSTMVDLDGSKTVHLILSTAHAPEVDETLPVINSIQITPKIVVAGKNVSIGISASDNIRIDSVWASIEGAATGDIDLINDSIVNYPANYAGTYNITFFANDSAGNEASKTDYFIAAQAVSFNASVFDYRRVGIVSSLVIYAQTGEEITSYSSSSGKFENKEIANYTYNLLFKAYDAIEVLLKNVSISPNLNKTIGIDKLPLPAVGYEKIYAIGNSYAISSARIKMNYGTYFPDEDSLGVYRCADWDFANRTCSRNWSKITAGVAQNKVEHYFEVNVTTLSAFKIKQEPYCGDGICGADENAINCSFDCNVTAVLTCSEGAIPSSGCKCGTVKRISGYCCNGTHQTTPCIAMLTCPEGEEITEKCLCGGTNYTSGYCCDGVHQTTSCGVLCEEGAIPSTGCKCGAFVRTSGYCCNDTRQTAPCGEEEEEGKKKFPFLLILLAVLIIGATAGAIVYFTRKKPELEEEREEGERREGELAIRVKEVPKEIPREEMPAPVLAPPAKALTAEVKPEELMTPEKVEDILARQKEKAGLEKIKGYIRKAKGMGFSDDQIRAKLLEGGCPAELVKKAFSELR